jgi:outer membrane phospholipase A
MRISGLPGGAVRASGRRYAQEATVKDKPAVRGSIIANLLQEHDNPFTLYPYESNYLLYTWTSDLNKEAIRSYDWAENARKDEVKFQLSLAFPLWRGILGEFAAGRFLYAEILVAALQQQRVAVSRNQL